MPVSTSRPARGFPASGGTHCLLHVTTLVEVLLPGTGSVVAEATVAVLVMVFLLPWMKKLSWNVTVPPAGTVPSVQVKVVPDGGGQPMLLDT